MGMELFRTIIAFGFTLLCATTYMLIALPFFLLNILGLKKPTSWVIYRMAQTWAKAIVFITGSAMDVQGIENIPKQGGVCFVSNHVGIFDVVLALAYIGRPFGFIAKKELALIPLIDLWILLLGGNYIDRNNIRKALKTINSGIQKLKEGGNMLIFPEGTRSKGRGILPFHSGSVKLATQSLAPIIPIAITGSYEVFEKNLRVHATQIRMVFCPPIYTAEMNADERRHQLADRIRLIIEDALARP